MLCYRCGSHNPDNSELCSACGQKLDARQAASTLRKRVGQGAVEGAPYRPGDIVSLRFRVREIIGAGPLGFVFKVEDVAAGGDLALKAINPAHFNSPDEREAFTRAMRLGRKLSHQNLVRVVEDGEDRGWPFFATQYVDGLSLRKIIEARRTKGQTFSLPEIEPLITQIALALTAAHKLAPHGNLKPENVLVQPDLLKVTDFGLAQAIPREPFIAANRASRTEAYVAPELFAGGPVEIRTDVYALGVLIGELVTGLVPQNRVVPDVARQRPDLPPAFDALYRKAVSSSPNARFATPAEVAGELSALLARSGSAGLGVPVATEPNADVPRRTVTSEPPPVAEEHLASRPAPYTRAPEPRPAPAPVSSPSPSPARLPVPAPPVTRPQIPEGATVPLDLSMLPAALKRTDETQQMDPGLIAQAIAAKVAASISSSGPVAPELPRFGAKPASPPGATGSPRPSGRAPEPNATQPQDVGVAGLRQSYDQSPTMALPAFPRELLEPAPPPLFGSSAGSSGPSEPRNSAMVWLVLLTVAALLFGTVGGYLLISRMRKRTPAVATQPAPVVSPPPAGAPPAVAGPSAASSASASVATPVAGGETPSDANAALLSCPDGMRLVPSGPFMMGTAKDDPMMGFDEKTLARTEVGAFCIDEYEYPNKYKSVPKTKVSWADANKACTEIGKRLCAENEWEKACKGPDNRRFPYGNTFDAAACNTETETGEDRRLSYAGGYDRCRSGYAVSDLSGNIAEWTATQYGSGGDKAIKGGAFDRPDYAARCSARRNGPPSTQAAEVGFRCCKDPG